MGYFSWRRRQRACATGVDSCRRLHLAHTTEDSVGAGNGGADALAAQQVPDKVALATAEHCASGLVETDEPDGGGLPAAIALHTR